MKIVKTSNYTGFNQETLPDYINDLDFDIQNVSIALQGRIRFGTGVDGARGENIEGRFQLFTSDGSADTEFTVAHGLGAIPIGRMIMYQDKAGSLYQGPTTGTNWDATNAFFKCDVASVTFLVFFIK